MKGRSFGISEAGQLLKAARSAAGFTSAKAAALNFGWSEPSMRAHESGTRRISPTDAEKYAEAFHIPAQAFLGGNIAMAEIAKLREAAYAAPPNATSAAGKRLKTTRKIRGFVTAFDFCVKFGFKLSTFGSHEAGINTISEPMAEAYALALGISTSWLLRGLLPSGLGEQSDAHLAKNPASIELDVRELSRLATSPPEVDPKRLAELIENAKARRPASNSDEDVVFEVQPTSFSHTSDPARLSRTWRLPKGFTRSVLHSSASDTVIVAVQHSVEGMTTGDRLFIDRSKRDPTAGGEFAYTDSKGQVILRSGAQDATSNLLGKVVARLTCSNN